MRAKFNLDNSSQGPTDAAQKTVASLYKKTPKVPVVLPKIPAKSAKIAGMIVVGVVILAIAIRIVLQLPKQSSVAKNPSTAQTPSPLSKEAVKDIVEKVKKHMVLPEETPQIVAITNVDSLKKQQVFFTLANNGDQLLVYPNKVILYRPTTDQVVDVAQIRPGGQLNASPSGLLK